MTNEQEIKDFVKERYGEVARQASQRAATSCCGSGAEVKDALCGEMKDSVSARRHAPEAAEARSASSGTSFASSGA